MIPAGFPHSDTSGSQLACSSPKIFAACHVLPRRFVPRHPPCALSRLTDISLRSRHAEPSCRPSHLTELAPVGPPKARHPRASIPRHPTPPGTATRVRPRHPTPPPSTLLRRTEKAPRGARPDVGVSVKKRPPRIGRTTAASAEQRNLPEGPAGVNAPPTPHPCFPKARPHPRPRPRRHIPPASRNRATRSAATWKAPSTPLRSGECQSEPPVTTSPLERASPASLLVRSSLDEGR